MTHRIGSQQKPCYYSTHRRPLRFVEVLEVFDGASISDVVHWIYLNREYGVKHARVNSRTTYNYGTARYIRSCFISSKSRLAYIIREITISKSVPIWNYRRQLNNKTTSYGLQFMFLQKKVLKWWYCKIYTRKIEVKGGTALRTY